MIRNNIDDLLDKIEKLKKEYDVVTNCFMNYNTLKNKIQNNEMQIYTNNGNIYITEQSDGFKYLYFYCKSQHELQKIDTVLKMFDINGTVVINILTNRNQHIDNYKKCLDKTKFKYYKRYLRKYCVYDSNAEYNNLLTVNFAEENDSYEIEDMINNTFDKYSDFLPKNKEIEQYIKNNNILVIKPKEEILGFLIFEDKGKSSYARTLCIREQYRNNIIGYELLIKYFNIHKNLFDRFTLWVDSSNDSVLSLHEKFGYKEDGLQNHVFIYN